MAKIVKLTPYRRLPKDMQRRFNEVTGLTGQQFNSVYNDNLTAETLSDKAYDFAASSFAIKMRCAGKIDRVDLSSVWTAVRPIFELSRKLDLKERRREDLIAEATGKISRKDIVTMLNPFIYFEVWRYKQYRLHPVIGVLPSGARKYSSCSVSVPIKEWYDLNEIVGAVAPAFNSAIAYHQKRISELSDINAKMHSFAQQAKASGVQ